MSLWSRIANVWRRDRLIREIDDELDAHLDEAITHGRDPAEARRAFGPLLRSREDSLDIRLIPWLDALRADLVYGWRLLAKSKTTSAAAILSLGLASGACVTAFRLIDGLLLRPLPVVEPERLYVLTRQATGPGSEPHPSDGFEYPLLRAMRAAAEGHAELIAVSYAERVDVTDEQDEQGEKAYRQYVSGGMFSSFGLQPALGRLLTERDDLGPRVHPYAVIAHDYWMRRFGQDPNVVGRTIRVGGDILEIIGVVDGRFSGTEPGTMTDIFLPATMHPGIDRADWSWFRTYVRLKSSDDARPVLDRLQAAFRAFRRDTAQQFAGRPQQSVDRYLNEALALNPAAAGVSALQADYSRSLVALAALVALVLLIAAANVSNLMTAQTAARSREMALRVSIGAGGWRLVQLQLSQAVWLSALSSLTGALFAWWSAPIVVRMVNPADDPARLFLPVDWRVLAFVTALTICVTGLFGLAPALGAARVKPISALKGGDGYSRSRAMQALIGLQVCFCVFVLFGAGLLLTTFDRLASQQTGFTPERLLTIDAIAPRTEAALWDQVAEQLAQMPGVERVAMSAWPLLSGNTWSAFVSINDRPAELQPYFLTASPGWFDVMKIPFVDGRDFLAGETYPGVAIVNQAFARHYFAGENPVGKSFRETPSRGNALPKEAKGLRYRVTIVGLVADARYRNMREPIRPTVYVPFRSADANGVVERIGWGTFLVRTTAAEPLSLASMLRAEVPRIRSEFRVSNIRTQVALNQSHTVRERLLATLGLFFAGVALLLASVGLAGVLRYSVLRRRREIGIRLALGSRTSTVIREVLGGAYVTVALGAFAGLMAGLASEPYWESLLYEVSADDPPLLLVPAAAMMAVAALSALPAAIDAVRTDPAIALRTD